MEIKLSLNKIGLSQRYQNLCSKFQNSTDLPFKMTNAQIKKVLNSFNRNFKYASKDKMYLLSFRQGNQQLNLGIEFKFDFIAARLFYIVDDEWVLFNRIDYLSEEIDPDYNREKNNLPVYKSEEDLKSILNEIFTIYDDIKKELV